MKGHKEYQYHTQEGNKYEERKSEAYSDSEYSSSYDHVRHVSSRNKLRPIENISKTAEGNRVISGRGHSNGKRLQSLPQSETKKIGRCLTIIL